MSVIFHARTVCARGKGRVAAVAVAVGTKPVCLCVSRDTRAALRGRQHEPSVLHLQASSYAAGLAPRRGIRVRVETEREGEREGER